MDTNNYSDYSKSNRYDVTLVITGYSSTDKIIFNSHKDILSMKSPYLRVAFEIFKKKEMEFCFPTDPYLTKLFLLSFYGDKNEFTPSQALQLVHLKDFLLMDTKIFELYDLVLSAEDFPLLLQTIDFFMRIYYLDVSSDLKLISMVQRNLPDDYDWKDTNYDFKTLILSNSYRPASAPASQSPVNYFNSPNNNENFAILEIYYGN